MMPRCLLVLSFAAAASCDSAPSQPATASATTSAAPGCEAQRALDTLDRRAPVPLLAPMAAHQKENMRDHLLAVQEIVTAAGAGDFERVERSAGRIGLSDEMHRMCSHMGQGAPGFTDQALEFHATADKIGEAARAKDPAAVMRALGDTLGRCNGCHASYRQQIVEQMPAP